MKTLKASLLDAVYGWALDNHFTPYLVAAADYPGVEVPESAVDQGAVVLNIHPRAIRDFVLDDDFVTFGARFSGQARSIVVPLAAVTALYAQENGEGVSFAVPEPPADPPRTTPPAPDRPTLKIVK
jgi:stringent starvation protein B